MERLLESFAFRILSAFTLAITLFGGGLCVLLDLPDDPTNLIVDLVMLFVTALWSFEMILRCLVERADYAISIFFWMDLLSIVSMIFEVSFLLGLSGKETTVDAGTNILAMRFMQLARMGLRFGRLCKPLRVLSLLLKGRRKPGAQADGYSAKLLGARLIEVFSAKVAILTVVLVVGVLVFGIGRYPEADFSLRLSSRKLEADYARAHNEVSSSGGSNAQGIFQASVLDIADFYSELNYQPFRLSGYKEQVAVDGRQATVVGSSLIDLEEPRRRQNVVVQMVSRCLVDRPGCDGQQYAAIYFDFTVANQYAAGLDMCLLVFIMLCMGFVICDVARTLNRMVVDPLERVLISAHSMTSQLNQALRSNGGGGLEEVSEENEDALASQTTLATIGSRSKDTGVMEETEILEVLFKKMSQLVGLYVEQNVVDEEKMQSLDNESKGVIVEVMRYDGRAETRRMSRKGSILSSASQLSVFPLTGDENLEPISRDAMLPDCESWGLNILVLDQEDRHKVAYFLICESDIGAQTGRIWLEAPVFKAFARRVEDSYIENPYHCFAHGIDVLGSCCRIIRQIQWEHWLTDVDACAFLIAALCHDIGHPGRTNPFLVATDDELALRYNDKSPLENMHCARLFEICMDNDRNVFKLFDRSSYKQARSVCIAAILYTDNALHFDLVKEIKRVYETSSDLCDAQVDSQDSFNMNYMNDVVQNNTMLWIKVILHMADVSNPLKTFEINKLWSMRVVDEFFAQGDEEKRLGIPVGMLNDRDKVPRAGAEHGFINFLLAPLVTSTVSVFPSLHPLAAQMVTNMSAWKELWISDAKPCEEDVRKRDEDIQVVSEKVAALKARCPPLARLRGKTVGSDLTMGTPTS